MADCNPHDCPVGVRVDALESEFNRYRSASSDTHRQMFDRIGALEQGRAAEIEKLDSIKETVETLAETVNGIASKPGKRWDGLVDKLIFLAAGAVLAWVVSGAPGLGT